jgi:ABC-type Na+ transport system ATPase subunit NatA
MSSHSLPELEAVCDGLAMLVDGRVAADGEVTALKARTPHGSLDRLFLEAVS